MSKEQVMQGVTEQTGQTGQTEQQANEAAAEYLIGSYEESLELARRVRGIIEDKKGLDVVLLDISKQSSFADFFVNATATNIRQLKTIEDDLGNELAKEGRPPRSTEGRPETGWILVDCGDVIVNLFLQAERDTYQIEKIWNDANIVEN
jgi:ribosome-associated protein